MERWAKRGLLFTLSTARNTIHPLYASEYYTPSLWLALTSSACFLDMSFLPVSGVSLVRRGGTGREDRKGWNFEDEEVKREEGGVGWGKGVVVEGWDCVALSLTMWLMASLAVSLMVLSTASSSSSLFSPSFSHTYFKTLRRSARPFFDVMFVPSYTPKVVSLVSFQPKVGRERKRRTDGVGRMGWGMSWQQ